MVRTQVQLTEEQAELLHRVSVERGVSLAALLREAVEVWSAAARSLSEDEKRRRAISAIGMLKDGPADLAERHDDYFVEAILH